MHKIINKTLKGDTYNNKTGCCLKTLHYPDSPNQKEFPSIILTPEQKYYSISLYKFGIK